MAVQARGIGGRSTAGATCALLLTAVFTGACAQGTVEAGAMPAEIPEGAQALPAEEVLSVQNAVSGIEEEERVVIEDAAAWADFWEAVHAPYAAGQAPPRPEVDFESHSVLAATGGLRNAQGFSFTIDVVAEHDGAIWAVVTENWPSCGTLPSHSAPVHAVAIPRTGLPVEFVDRVQRPDCD